MTKTPAIAFGPRPEPGECYVCEIELLAHDEPRFTARDDTGELCPDCVGELDPPRSAALRALAYSQRQTRTLPPETPSIEAFFTVLAAGLRELRDYTK
jgi:hypothetical protein